MKIHVGFHENHIDPIWDQGMSWLSRVLTAEYFWLAEYELSQSSVKLWHKLELREVGCYLHFRRSIVHVTSGGRLYMGPWEIGHTRDFRRSGIHVTSKGRTYMWLWEVGRAHDFGRSGVHVTSEGRESMWTREIGRLSGEYSGPERIRNRWEGDRGVPRWSPSDT